MKYKCGDSYELIKTITDKDILSFAKLSNDYNPIHFEDEAARLHGYKKRIVHGMYVGNLFSRIIGTELPGDGTIYVSQELFFKRPIYANDLIRIVVTIIEISDDFKYRIKTQCFKGDKIAVDGEAIVLFREEK